ncbi:MAG TPA: tetratricopeptide repeat protein [Vicinamibacterales bacterium]|nr:tetratricopeptide repeat protein [Vicinamibacterales bacterium]
MRPLILIVVLAVSACSSSTAQQSQPSAAPDKAVISITSKSPEAVAHLKKGEALLVNVRAAEASAEFAQALKVDPDFVLAHAYHGQATPGAEGLKEVESAASAASALPEAERTLVQGLLAARQGESAKARDAYAKLVELTPADWRGHYLLGTQLLNDEDYGGGVPALRRAVELDPAAGGANNMLGYAALRQGDTDGAVKAFTDYANALPQEPNAQDSLGEALLAAGKFKEAEAAFRKALDLSPQFFPAWDGIAYTRYFAGDAAGALDALTKEKAAATRPLDKLGADELRAVMTIAQKKTAPGLSLYSDLEKMTDAMPAVAFVPVHRAGILVDLGRAREALPVVDAALKRADGGELPAGVSRNLRQQALRVRVAAEAATSASDAAAKTAMDLQQQANERKDDVNAQSAMHYGLGMAAIAKRDYAAAKGHFEQCLTFDAECRRQIAAAAQKAGDKDGAEAARAALLKLYVRDPVHLWVRSRLMATTGSTSTE